MTHKLIKQLINPKTQSYLEFKNFVLSLSFSWYWNSLIGDQHLNVDGYHNIGHYGHVFLERPEQVKNRIPRQTSEYLNDVSNIILEILESNNIEVNSFLRISANCVHSSDQILNSTPHVDHEFDHKNILLYLTNVGGSTVVKDEIFTPNEDDIILFGGETHYMQTPQKDRRVVLVATFV
ncbi:hypothetical protein EBR43_07085 [bacterium]|nr:hypothetical protein [bacterium]